MTQIQQHIVHAVKDAPPIAIGSFVLFGIQLSDVVLILTAVYTVIRIFIELHTWYVRNKNGQSK